MGFVVGQVEVREVSPDEYLPTYPLPHEIGQISLAAGDLPRLT